jgi:hypothetical protein
MRFRFTENRGELGLVKRVTKLAWILLEGVSLAFGVDC